MGIHNLERVFSPGVIAVVGDFKNRGSVASGIVRNLSEEGYPGIVCPVCRKSGAMGRGDIFSSIADIREEVDLVVLAEPMERVPGLLEQCVHAGAKGAVIISETGRETLAQPRVLEQAVRHVSGRSGLRVIGPGRFGLYSGKNRLRLWADNRRPPAGSIAFISPSAAVCSSVLDHALTEGIGFSHYVCAGDMFDVDFGDLIDYFGNDPAVSSIVIHMERLFRHRNFMSAARAVSRVKPIVVLKTGRRPESDPFSLGAPAHEDAFYDTAFARAGVVRVKTFEALFDCAEFLAKQPHPGGEGLAIVSNGMGPGQMAADAMWDYGIAPATLSRETLRRLDRALHGRWNRANPLNITVDADEGSYCEAVRECLGASEVHGLLLIHAPAAGTDPSCLADALVPMIRKTSRPVFAAWMGGSNVLPANGLLNRAGIPTFNTPERAVRAFAALCRYEKNRKMLHEIPERLPVKPRYNRDRAEALIAAIRASGASSLGKERADALLAAYGIPVKRGCSTTGTRLELSAGSMRGGDFGPVIYFGAGGRLGEIARDRGFALPPLNRLLARRLMEETRVHPYLAGAGASFPERMAELEEILVCLSQLIVDFPEVREVSLDPLVVDPSGIWVTDARLSLDMADSHASRHLVISPYPNHYESHAVCKNGVMVFIRPIRPEDARPLSDLYASLSAQSMFRRFFTVMRQVPERMLARFTQIDYDREMAMVAIRECDGEEEIVGVARIIPEWNRKKGEFAVVTRDAWQGLGVGAALMERLLPIAQKMGIEKIYGLVLAENTQMLAFGRKLGMERKPGTDSGEQELSMDLSPGDAGPYDIVETQDESRNGRL